MVDDQEARAIAAYLANKGVTKCPDGSAMEQVERDKIVADAKARLYGSPGRNMRGPRANKKCAHSAYHQRHENRVLTVLGKKQMREKNLSHADVPLGDKKTK